MTCFEWNNLGIYLYTNIQQQEHNYTITLVIVLPRIESL
jgi:hypothetical protein